MEDEQVQHPVGHEAKVVTLCGSTRFEAEFAEVNARLTMEGHLVFSLGLFRLPNRPGDDRTSDEADLRERLAAVHLAKVRMADEVYVVDPDGHVGESTRREIAYAESLGKPVRYLSRERARRRADVTDVLLVGGVERRELVLVEHDPAWADVYATHEARVRGAIGEVAVAVEHIGSTSVPGLAAKPIIDVLVTVPDITAEEDYLDPLVAAGYVLRVREPGHRLVRTPQRDVHVHLLEPDDPAADDYLLLRDRLRVDAGDRELYEATKRHLVARDWADMNDYAEAKTGVIEEIKARARRT